MDYKMDYWLSQALNKNSQDNPERRFEFWWLRGLKPSSHIVVLIEVGFFRHRRLENLQFPHTDARIEGRQWPRQPQQKQQLQYPQLCHDASAPLLLHCLVFPLTVILLLKLRPIFWSSPFRKPISFSSPTKRKERRIPITYIWINERDEKWWKLMRNKEKRWVFIGLSCFSPNLITSGEIRWETTTLSFLTIQMTF